MRFQYQKGVWLWGHRIHHGPVALAIAAAGIVLRRPWLALAGIFWAVDDLADHKSWITELLG